MVKIATQCINFFVSINVAKFAISVWRFPPHCVVENCVENQITTLSVVKIAIKFSPCTVIKISKLIINVNFVNFVLQRSDGVDGAAIGTMWCATSEIIRALGDDFAKRGVAATTR